MRVTIVGNAALDEPCVCGRCGHRFMTSEAVTKVDRTSGELVDGLIVCCPECFSDDVTSLMTDDASGVRSPGIESKNPIRNGTPA